MEDIHSSAAFNDDELFPGWSFDSDQEQQDTGSTAEATPPPLRLLDTLGKMSAKEKRMFEKKVIQRHTEYGAVSLFKGVEEMGLAKSRAQAMREVLRIKDEIGHCESSISELEHLLGENRVFFLSGL
jgi:hypothetical protein